MVWSFHQDFLSNYNNKGCSILRYVTTFYNQFFHTNSFQHFLQSWFFSQIRNRIPQKIMFSKKLFKYSQQSKLTISWAHWNCSHNSIDIHIFLIINSFFMTCKQIWFKFYHTTKFSTMLFNYSRTLKGATEMWGMIWD